MENYGWLEGGTAGKLLGNDDFKTKALDAALHIATVNRDNLNYGGEIILTLNAYGAKSINVDENG